MNCDQVSRRMMFVDGCFLISSGLVKRIEAATCLGWLVRLGATPAEAGLNTKVAFPPIGKIGKHDTYLIPRCCTVFPVEYYIL
eukprot:321112-Amphidinium_carterae.1